MNDSRVHRAARAMLLIASAVALGFALVWTFLAYRDPDLVIGFATLLQMCGITLAR